MSNTPAIISGTSVGSVVEAGGRNNAIAGTPTATGTLTATDVDNPANTFTAVAAATASASGYGAYTITAGGVWTYTLNNANASVQALNIGQTLADTFVVTTVDGTAQVVTVTINGANDDATFTANGFVSVTEAGGVNNAIAGTPTASNTIVGSDIDGPFTPFTVVSTPTTTASGYGTFTVAADGTFTYTVNNNNPAVQALNVGTTLFDNFDIHSADGTSVQITATIAGANDAAVIGGTSTGSVVEAGGRNNAIAGTPTATGTLTATDVDNPANTFTAVAAATASASGYGAYTITAGGVWTYTLNNANASVQALNIGQTLADTFVVTTVDGTAQVVTVTINGANDDATFTANGFVSVTEAGGVNNAIAGTPTASNTIVGSDIDGPFTPFTVVSTPTTTASGYGTFTVAADGTFTYTVNNNNPAVQALNVGTTLFDNFDIHSADGTSVQITATIAGANDAAVIGGTSTGSVVEAGGRNNVIAGTPTATGTLTATDVDNPANTFTAVAAATTSSGGYGTYTITAGGVWTYAIDNANPSVEALNVGQTLTDSFTVQSVDGTPQVVSVTINGTNDASVIGGVSTGSVIEAGGLNNAIAGTPTATGTLSAADVDGPANTFTAVSVATASTGGYGTYTVTAGGVWTYILNNTNASVQALNVGETLTDTFAVASIDGTAQVVTATINGTNDAAVISGAASGSVIEAGGVNNAIVGTPTATGTLTSTDVDNAANTFTAVSVATASTGGYGTYTVTAGGVWTYMLDNANASVQALNVGQTLTDTFVVTSIDGTAKVVTTTINGTNDAAVISGAASGSVTEAGGLNNAIAGTPTATGTLTAADVDGPANTFTAVSVATTSTGGYGTYTVTAGGVWTYILNNTNASVQALNVGETLTDSFVVTSIDGAAKVVTTTINGTNDASVIDGVSTGAVIEAGGLNAGTPTATGALTVADIDNPANTFTAVSVATTSIGGYGAYTITAGGVWTYTLDNANPSVETLNAGQTLIDSFTVQSLDGTSQVVSVVINGTTDPDVTPPTVSIALASSNLHADQTSLVSFTFSEDPGASFSDSSVAVSGGALGAISGTGLVRTAVFTPTAATNDGVASISVTAGAYTDAAGNGGGAGAPVTLTFDTLAPSAPAAPSLAVGSDTGASATDNVTDVLTPTLTGAAEAGATVTLYDTDGTTVLGTSLAVGGVWSITSSTLGGGTHGLSVRATDPAGNESMVSATLEVRIHTANTPPTGALTISGTPTQGLALTLADSLADADGLGVVSYQWKAGGAIIVGATDSSFTPGQAQVGQPITVTASYIDGFGAAESVTSIATANVANVNDLPTGAVSVAGQAIESQVLSASNTLADLDGMGVVSYQWQRNGVDISGATAAAYTLTAADAGSAIRVAGSYFDGQGATEQVFSLATSIVSSANQSAPITTDTTLTAGPGTTLSVSGGIGGTAVVTLDGGGIVVLSGTNTSTGGVIIAPGTTVQAGPANLTPVVVNNSTLQLNQAGAFSGVISGVGALEISGGGRIEFTGTNSYTGATTISSGTLSVNGAISGSPVTVQSGGTLGGSGVTGTVSVEAGAILAAGNSPGILHMSDLTFAAGAAFNVELASAASFDQADVTGTVNLGGATLNLSLLGGFAPSAGETFIIVNNDGTDAVTGIFSGLAQGASITVGGVALTISYAGGTGNDVTLTAPSAPVVITPGGGTTPPQTGAASAIASTSSALGFDAGSAKALSPVVALMDGSIVTNPNYVTAQKAATIQAQHAAGLITDLQAKEALVDLAFATKGVAVETYSFFTGAPPSAGGVQYLVDSSANPSDLTDPYFAAFNATNRYINLAVSLGATGEGKAAFQAAYGQLTFEQAVVKAYDAVIGVELARHAGYDPEAGETYVISQKSYFQALGGNDLGAKAAVVGYLLSVGVEAHLGAYYSAAHDLIQSQVQLVGVAAGGV